MGRRASPANLWEFKLEQKTLTETLQQKPGLARWLGMWMLLGLGLSVSGLALTLRLTRRSIRRRVFRYRPRLPHTWSRADLARMVTLVVELIVLLPLLRASLTLMAWPSRAFADHHLWIVLSMLMLDGLIVLIVWAFAATQSLSLSRVLGLSARRAPKAIAQGFMAYTTMFPWLLGLLGLMAIICERLGIRPPQEPLHELLFLEPRGFIVGLTVALACVVGPVAEEVLFRGVLFAGLRTFTSRLTAMLISSAVFAVAHTNLIGFLPILLLGCLLATLYERTGSLLSPMAVHVFHNALLIGVSLTVKAFF